MVPSMAAGKRPGGLTALAVLNFVFSGFGVLSALGLLYLLQVSDQVAAQAKPEDRAVFEAFQQVGAGMWFVLLASSILTSALLVAAGVGYLKMRRWGRTVGNAYALIEIAASLFGVVAMPAAIGGGFTISTMIGLVYPVLTLILLNTTFREDLA